MMENHEKLMSALPSTMPTRGYISSNFGPRRSPFTGERVMHRGLDIAAREGTEVIAPSDGEVLYAQHSRDDLGNVVVIDHGYGVQTKYGHLKKFNVRKGQKVTRGEKIAIVGNTGRSTGAHLHFEAWVADKRTNPLHFLANKDWRVANLSSQEAESSAPRNYSLSLAAKALPEYPESKTEFALDFAGVGGDRASEALDKETVDTSIVPLSDNASTERPFKTPISLKRPLPFAAISFSFLLFGTLLGIAQRKPRKRKIVLV